MNCGNKTAVIRHSAAECKSDYVPQYFAKKDPSNNQARNLDCNAVSRLDSLGSLASDVPPYDTNGASQPDKKQKIVQNGRTIIEEIYLSSDSEDDTVSLQKDTNSEHKVNNNKLNEKVCKVLRFVCPKCERHFSSKYALSSHYFKSHKKKFNSDKLLPQLIESFKCGYCNVSFFNAENLKVHLLNFHRVGITVNKDTSSNNDHEDSISKPLNDETIDVVTLDENSGTSESLTTPRSLEISKNLKTSTILETPQTLTTSEKLEDPKINQGKEIVACSYCGVCYNSKFLEKHINRFHPVKIKSSLAQQNPEVSTNIIHEEVCDTESESETKCQPFEAVFIECSDKDLCAINVSMDSSTGNENNDVKLDGGCASIERVLKKQSFAKKGNKKQNLNKAIKCLSCLKIYKSAAQLRSHLCPAIQVHKKPQKIEDTAAEVPNQRELDKNNVEFHKCCVCFSTTGDCKCLKPLSIKSAKFWESEFEDTHTEEFSQIENMDMEYMLESKVEIFEHSIESEPDIESNNTLQDQEMQANARGDNILVNHMQETEIGKQVNCQTLHSLAEDYCIVFQKIYLMCVKCNHYFESQRQFLAHSCAKRMDHTLTFPANFPCVYCHELCSSLESALLHLQETHPVSCTTCLQEFPSLEHLKHHTWQHRMGQIMWYQCILCGKDFKKLADCRYHIFIDHNKEDASTEMFLKLVSKSLTIRDTSSVATPFWSNRFLSTMNCPFCDLNFKSIANLSYHFRLRHNMIKCLECSNHFIPQNGDDIMCLKCLEPHNSGPNQFDDSIAQNVISSYVGKLHIHHIIVPLVHSKGQNVVKIQETDCALTSNSVSSNVCHICFKLFSSPSNLARHICPTFHHSNEHTENNCNQEYLIVSNRAIMCNEDTTNLKNNVLKKVPRFMCPICSIAFLPKSIAQHLIQEHKFVKCNACSYKFMPAKTTVGICLICKSKKTPLNLQSHVYISVTSIGGKSGASETISEKNRCTDCNKFISTVGLCGDCERLQHLHSDSNSINKQALESIPTEKCVSKVQTIPVSNFFRIAAFKCNYCNEWLKSLNSLQDHLQRMHAIKKTLKLKIVMKK